MAIFHRAKPEVYALMTRVVDRWHPDLAECRAKIGVVMAYAKLNDDGEATAPALTSNGLRILGKIKINGPADRCDGKPDATITLDGDYWDGIDTPQREALIDHELYHLEARREPATGDKPGPILVDILDRPLFTARRHDWELTGFRAVAERNGIAAAEVIEARAWHDRHGNLLFSFAAEFAAGGES